ncbi:MAG: putative heme-binding domain-containing protein [Verrucomicrobiales bacterium]|jgi:putative heme-binding domain-containing protein
MKSSIPIFALALLTAGAAAQNKDADTTVAGNDQVADIIKNYEGRGTLADDTPPTPPKEAVKKFQVRDGFEIELMAAEPDVSQPLFATWDSRGRMWVVQYRQYQFPAGLKIVSYDNHLRAVFDKVPEPPPHGTPGADKITVFEDTDGDGFYDKNKDVITGLNIASSVQVGRGGIWVLNPPYLLFYPDADGDDVPDGDPEVHLSGFGLQDTHSVSNSLTWGPDGWLYGANGSTTIGNVSSEVTKDVYFEGQCIWRYDPGSKRFEIFGEGGGNTFSLDIDSKGRVFSGTNGGSTRGMYYPQGSYGSKNWGKHGPLTNPYAFGNFVHMKHEGDNRRFAQAFMIYEGGLFPDEFEGMIIGPNSLHNVVWASNRLRDTSSYRTVDTPNLVETDDRWFRPVWGGVGPDGGVYIGDWYDTRLSHVRPVDDWHKESGRIYRVKPAGSQPKWEGGDLAKLEPGKMLELLDHPNKWVRRRAVLEIGWRKLDVQSELLEMIGKGGQSGLEALWAQNMLNSIDPNLYLDSPDEHLRRVGIQLSGNVGVGAELAQLAETEADVQVRSQIASTARRVKGDWAIATIQHLLRRSEDIDDLHMPLMNWWALEGHAETSWDLIEEMFRNPEFWQLPMVRATILERLMQRYAMAGGTENFIRCARLLELAPDDDSREQLLIGIDRAFQGMTLPELPAALSEALEKHQAARGNSGLVLSLRQGKEGAAEDAIKAIADRSADIGERAALIRTLGEIAEAKAVPTLIKLISDPEHAIKRVAMQALTHFDEPKVAATIVGRYGSSLPSEHDVRATANRTLASRASWAKVFLGKIDIWHIKTSDVSADVVQQLRAYADPEIQQLVEKHFGVLDTVSSPEKLAEIARIKKVLGGEPGDAKAGKFHFTTRCTACHKLFDEGGLIGPDLTPYERGNVDFWLPGIIDPSLEIREGYQTYIARMKDGRVLTGMMAEQAEKTVTLRDAANQTTILSRADINELQASPMSLMPDLMLTGLTDDQLRDLFAYLSQNPGSPPPK